MGTFLIVLFWLGVWAIISTLTYIFIVYTVALELEHTFIEALYSDDAKDPAMNAIAVIFIIGLPLAIYVWLSLIWKKGKLANFTIGTILRKIFHKKHIRERVMKEI